MLYSIAPCISDLYNALLDICDRDPRSIYHVNCVNIMHTTVHVSLEYVIFS